MSKKSSRKKAAAAAKKPTSRNTKRKAAYAGMAGQGYSPAKLAKKAIATVENEKRDEAKREAERLATQRHRYNNSP